MASIRSISVILGLGAGCVAAILMDRFALPDLAASNLSFLTPEALPFGFGIEPVMVLIMMPIFIVSATESIGDLTATNRLSGHCHGDESYWLRIRGGLMGDSLNSGLASVLGTFPNTTFSQNNGVIRATGASNPVIGIYASVVLIGLGFTTTVAWIQAIPETVVKGMTLILFSLVVFAGFSLVRSAAPQGLRLRGRSDCWRDGDCYRRNDQRVVVLTSGSDFDLFLFRDECSAFDDFDRSFALKRIR